MPSPTSNSVAVIHTSLINAGLGVGLGLHDDAHVADVFGAISFPPPVGGPTTAVEYQAALRDACHGREITSVADPRIKIREGTTRLFKTNVASGCIRSGYVSQVVGWRDLVGCLSEDDKARFFGLSTAMTPGIPALPDPIWSDMMSLVPTQRNLRRFSPDPGSAWLTKPVHWWTPRAVTETILMTVRPEEWADTLRDRLGKYYDEHDSMGTAAARMKNRRFLFHIPAAILIGKGHFRPNFADAGGYRRFATHRSLRKPASPAAWGMTADLGVLCDKGRLQNGLKERVTPSLTIADFGTHEIEFDYLGEVKSARGQTPGDDDRAFERKLHAVHRKLFPADEARLSARVAALPVMAP